MCWPRSTVAPEVQPETRYAKSGGVSLAYQVVGEGPIDVVFTPGFVSNVDYWWEVPTTQFSTDGFDRTYRTFCCELLVSMTTLQTYVFKFESLTQPFTVFALALSDFAAATTTKQNSTHIPKTISSNFFMISPVELKDRLQF